MTQQDSWSEREKNQIILKKGKWQLRLGWAWADNGSRNDWNSVLRHQCGKGHYNTHDFAPYLIKRCHCKARPPKYLIKLWYLHNMDKIGEKR